ncbi:MAG: nitrite reductase/ring-hydroxylating ferredoxin subunit, partial [Candidatus Azotimanducaceae bacterium]
MKDMIKILTEPSDPALSPGEARCPGPSVREVLESEDSRFDIGLMSSKSDFLGDRDLPFSRYTSLEFYQNEIDHLWPKVWQWACREEHIPNPGDYMVYDVGPYSALVIRGEDNQQRAFVNSCPHRGMQLADSGSAGNKTFIRCPFHGMTWQTDGSLRE